MRTTSEEFMDKRIMELSGSRCRDFYDHDFFFYPTRVTHPGSSITEKAKTMSSVLLRELVLRCPSLKPGHSRLAEELKDFMECNQGKTDGKLQELEILLREFVVARLYQGHKRQAGHCSSSSRAG
ncbi:hypothetical protein MLD38_021878 [Melastoma candidum]|uniref:Uncharacterized protein n=1 Tax=Melastoma candidum TaxID=119954 RepID=A0ACB9QGN0_9MYRT|nr:hypothetical protein MLD38_021878 [Melastoma candidum]